MTNAISISDVSKRFRIYKNRNQSLKGAFLQRSRAQFEEFWALSDVSFDIPQGKTFGLLGHNGSGKSTLLKCIARILAPDKGSIATTGRMAAMLEVGSGFHPELSGRENIYLNGSILGRSRRQIDESLDWIIEFADIGDFIDEPVKVYSSGMTVRLGFATAVAIKPTILIVDEIIAVGDEEFQRKCFDLMRELRDKGTTIALVTHSLSLATEMCDEIVWLDHGRVQMVGSADKVVSAYLTAVNEKEARKRSEEAGEFPEDDQYKMNQGTGECRMTRVEVLDDDGAALPFISYGRPATLRIHVRAREELHDVELGLGFTTDGGVTVAGPNSRAAGTLYTLGVGDAFVDYRIDSVVFQPGRLWLTTCFVRDGHIYDLSDRRTELIVRADQTMDEPGLVTLPRGTWSGSPGVSVIERPEK